MATGRPRSQPPGHPIWLPGAAAFAVGAVAALVLRFGRGFFWPHAVISGLAVAALAYSAWRTWTSLSGASPLGAGQATPRKGEERADEEEVHGSTEAKPQKQELHPRREGGERDEEPGGHDKRG